MTVMPFDPPPKPSATASASASAAPAAPLGPGTTANVGDEPVLDTTGVGMSGSFYQQEGRSGPPIFAGNLPQKSTFVKYPIADEVRRFQRDLYEPNPSRQTQIIVQGLAAAGRIKPTATPTQIVVAYQKLLEQSGESFDPKTGTALTPTQILDVDIEFVAASASNKPKTATKEQYFTQYTDEQAKNLARDGFRAAFGRNPTQQEANQYVRALRKAAASAPRQMVYNPDGTRYMTDGFNFQQWNQGYLAAKMPIEEDLGGEFGVIQDRMQQALTEYGLDVSEDFRWNMLRRIGEGTATIETAVEQIKDLAKVRYSALAEQIDRGLTVQQVADPYLRRLNAILERADASVTDPLVSQALNFTDEKGNPRLMSEREFEGLLRSQPEWQKTVNAKEEALSLADSVLAQMGFGA